MPEPIPFLEENDAQAYKGLTLRGEDFRGLRFFDCTFSKCDFSESIFQGCIFRNCEFKNCQLNLVKVTDTSFSDARFQNSQLMGVDWTDARWDKKMRAITLAFRNCSVNHNTFMNMCLTRLVMVNCSALDVNFQESDLTNSDLHGTDFSGSRFHHTILSAANLAGAKNYAISAQNNTLKKTRFSLPEALSLLYAMDIEIVQDESE